MLKIQIRNTLKRLSGKDRSYDEIIEQISNASQKVHNAFRLSYRNEIMNFSNKAQIKALEDSGIKEITIEGKSGACEKCSQHFDKKIKIEDAPSLPIHYNCKCVAVPVIGNEKLNLGREEVCSYPARSRKACEECQKVVSVMNKMIGPSKKKVVCVITHKDGTVSVGFSCRGSAKDIKFAKQLESKLNKGLKRKIYTVSGESMPIERLVKSIDGNEVGECAEPKAVNAAHSNLSEIEGMDTRWRPSDKDNPYHIKELMKMVLKWIIIRWIHVQPVLI